MCITLLLLSQHAQLVLCAAVMQCRECPDAANPHTVMSCWKPLTAMPNLKKSRNSGTGSHAITLQKMMQPLMYGQPARIYIGGTVLVICGHLHHAAAKRQTEKVTYKSGHRVHFHLQPMEAANREYHPKLPPTSTTRPRLPSALMH